MRNCGEHFECVDGTCQERLERLPESTGTTVAFQGNEDEEPINIVNSLITLNLTKSDEKSNLNSSVQATWSNNQLKQLKQPQQQLLESKLNTTEINYIKFGL